MKKTVLLLVVFCLMLLISSCTQEVDDYAITAGSSPTTEEQLVIDPLQEEGYLFAVKFHTDSIGMNVQTLYLWDNQLRSDMQDSLIEMMNQIVDFSISVLEFSIEINQDITISVSGTEVLESEMSLDAFLVASMFPNGLKISRIQLINYMAPVVASIETSPVSGSEEIVWVKTLSDLSFMIQNASIVENEIYGFKTLDEYLIFLGIGE
jgi:hypothetical protein